MIHGTWDKYLPLVWIGDGGGCVLASPSLFLGIAARLGATRHPEVLRHFGLHFMLFATHEDEIVFFFFTFFSDHSARMCLI